MCVHVIIFLQAWYGYKAMSVLAVLLVLVAALVSALAFTHGEYLDSSD